MAYFYRRMDPQCPFMKLTTTVKKCWDLSQEFKVDPKVLHLGKNTSSSILAYESVTLIGKVVLYCNWLLNCENLELKFNQVDKI